jgi:hypothetical protein
MRLMHSEVAEGSEVVEWRGRQLVGAGFAAPLARRLAADSRYDLHALIELTELGCPHALAVRILAPLDGPEGST